MNKTPQTPQTPSNCSSSKASHSPEVQSNIVFCDKDEEVQIAFSRYKCHQCDFILISYSQTTNSNNIVSKYRKRKQHSSVPMKIYVIKKIRKSLVFMAQCFRSSEPIG